MAIWQGNMRKSLKYGMAWKYVKEINVETHNIIDDDVPYWDKVIFQNHHLYKKTSLIPFLYPSIERALI